MSDDKSRKLIRAVKELNIGMNTIVDVLASKGYKIDMQPMARLDGEMGDTLLKEFAADKIASCLCGSAGAEVMAAGGITSVLDRLYSGNGKRSIFLNKRKGPDRHPAPLKNPISYEKPNCISNPRTKTG